MLWSWFRCVVFFTRTSRAGGGDGSRTTNDDYYWALASIFGEEQHALLNLWSETHNLLVDLGTDKLDDKSTLCGCLW